MNYWKTKGKRAMLLLMSSCLFALNNTRAQTTPNQELVEIKTSYGTIIIRLYKETPIHRDNFIRNVKAGTYDSLLFDRVVPQLVIQGGDPKSKHAYKGETLGQDVRAPKLPMEFNKNVINKRGAIGALRDYRETTASSSIQFYIVQGRTFSADELMAIEVENNIRGKKTIVNKFLSSDSINRILDDFKLRGDKDGLHRYMSSLETVFDSIYEPYYFQYSAEQRVQYTQIGGAPNLDGQFTVFGEVIKGMEIVDSIANEPFDGNNRPQKDIRMTMKLIPTSIPNKQPAKQNPQLKDKEQTKPKPVAKKR